MNFTGWPGPEPGGTCMETVTMVPAGLPERSPTYGAVGAELVSHFVMCRSMSDFARASLLASISACFLAFDACSLASHCSL